MSDRTTTVAPMHLRLNTVITRYPDPRDEDRFDKPGRWTVTALPAKFDAWVRVDYRDGLTDGVWILPVGAEITVELSGPEMVAAGVGLVAKLARSGLPQMWSWDINPDGVRGLLYGGNTLAEAERELGAWSEHLNVAKITREDRDNDMTSMRVKGAVDGVPIEVRAAFHTPKPAEQARDSK